MIYFIHIFYNRKIYTNLRWSSELKQMFIIPIQELDEIVKDHFGSVDAQTQSTKVEAELPEQPRSDDVDEEERNDTPDWEKMKVGLYF